MNKILVFGITDKAGGIESVIMNYYRNIDKTKIQFDFLCNNEKVAYKDEIEKLGGVIYKIPARSKDFTNYKKSLKIFFKLHAKEYSTIWVNICSLANIDYLKYAKKYGIKYRIIHSHNSKNMDSKIREILHKINKIRLKKYATDFWTCSNEAGKWFYSNKIIKSSKYVLINNAIDTKKFEYDPNIRIDEKERLNLKNKLVIGHVGRFHFQKNHKFIIEIFYEILKKNKNAVLLLVGIGSLIDEIKEKAKGMGIYDNIFFLGERNDIDRLMQAMDVFLFPSLFEGLPLALIEAQASGIPILASKDVIPYESNMSVNFKFISLDEKAKTWANILLQTDLSNKSQENIKIIKKAGFDIKVETRKIEKFFLRD